MDAKEKLDLIGRIISESFEWGVDVCENNGFLQGVISAIDSVVHFGEEEKEDA